MNLVPELPIYIDSTMRSAFVQCEQKFFTEFCLGLRPSSMSIDLHAGACFASALEDTYTRIYTPEKPELSQVLQTVAGSFLSRWGDVVPDKDTPKTCENVWNAIEAYFENWSPLTDPVQPLYPDPKESCEFTFAIPLEPAQDEATARAYANGEMPNGFPLHPSGQPFIYSGRFDMLGLWANTKPVVKDEKTTKYIASDWSEQWDLRAQFLGYVWACQRSGIKLDTVCVRGIGIKKKSPPTLVEAFKTYASWEIDRWYEQLRRDLWRLRRAWDEKYFAWNLADACSAYGGCPFRILCKSPNPSTWYSQYQVRKWNPLQKNPIAPSPPTASLEEKKEVIKAETPTIF